MKPLSMNENKENLIIPCFNTKHMQREPISACSLPVSSTIIKNPQELNDSVFNCKKEIKNVLYMRNREVHIEWICEISSIIGCGTYAQDLAIRLFDMVNFTYPYAPDTYKTILLVCLAIAYKFSTDNIYLSYSDLNKHCPNTTSSSLKELEIEILERINWRVYQKLPIEYIFLYTELDPYYCNHSSDNTLACKNQNQKIRKFAYIFAEVANRIYYFIDKSPSLIACTCIALARKRIGVTDYWNKENEVKTKIRRQDLLLDILERKCKSLINS